MQIYTPPIKSIGPTKQTNAVTNTTHDLPLHAHVEDALNTYFIESEGQPEELYKMLLSAVEPALLKVVFKFCKTQDEAAKVLGLSRGTIRKKLIQYRFI